jgi:hypothetical protein
MRYCIALSSNNFIETCERFLLILKWSCEDHPADVEQFVEYLTVPENTHQSKGGVE